MVVTIGGIKGGSGKSLAACNLLIMRRAAGIDALLVDADDQRSASEFVAQRAALGHGDVPCVQLAGKTVRNQLILQRARYADIVVDTGGRDTASQRSALTASDIMLIPFQPGNFDMWTLSQVEGLVEDIRSVNPDLRAVAYISRGLPVGSDNAEAREMLLASSVIETVDITLTNRKAFNTAAGDGLAVVEATARRKEERERLGKAAAEMRSLYDFVFSGMLPS